MGRGGCLALPHSPSAVPVSLALVWEPGAGRGLDCCASGCLMTQMGLAWELLQGWLLAPFPLRALAGSRQNRPRSASWAWGTARAGSPWQLLALGWAFSHLLSGREVAWELLWLPEKGGNEFQTSSPSEKSRSCQFWMAGGCGRHALCALP